MPDQREALPEIGDLVLYREDDNTHTMAIVDEVKAYGSIFETVYIDVTLWAGDRVWQTRHYGRDNTRLQVAPKRVLKQSAGSCVGMNYPTVAAAVVAIGPHVK